MSLNEVTVAAILAEKGATVHSVDHQAAVGDAVAEMNRRRVGSILVMRGEEVVGIFTERDVLTRVVEGGRVASETAVREVMTEDLQRISPQTSVEEAMSVITRNRARHLPVFDGDRLAGLVSIGDILRWLLKLNENEATNLKRYLFGEYPG